MSVILNIEKNIEQHLGEFLEDTPLSNDDIRKCSELIITKIFEFQKEMGFDDKRIRKTTKITDANSYNFESGLPFTFNLKRINDHIVKIQIFGPSAIEKFELGKGSYKKTKKSISFIVDLQGHEPIQHYDSVIQRSVQIYRNPENNSITTCLEKHKKLLDKLGQDVKIVPVPEYRVYMTKQKKYRFELEQKWYPGDLYQAIEMGKLPLKMYGDDRNERELDFVDKFAVLRDVAQTLHKIHKEAFVVRDIKPANILVKLDDQVNVAGYLFDFDLMQLIGLGDKDDVEDYYYYDACSREMLVTPSTDIYGLALSAAEAFLPNFYQFEKEKESYHFEQNQTMKTEMLKLCVREKMADLFPIGIPADIIFTIVERLKISDAVTPKAFYDATIKILQDHLKDYREDPYQINMLTKFEAELYCMMEILDLVAAQKKRSAGLYQYICENSDIRDELISENVKDRLEAIGLLSKNPRIYITAEEFARQLAVIEENFRSRLPAGH